MLTLKVISQETEKVLKGLEKKHFKNAEETINKVLELDKERRAAQQELDNVLAQKQAEYDGLKRKDTQRASNLLMQMENLRLRKANSLSKFDKRIENTQNRLDKMIAEEDAVKERMYGKRRKEAHEGIVNDIKAHFTSKGLDLDSLLG